MIKAYSYIRYSSAEQSKGRSYDRQLERCEKYCLDNGLTLSDERFFDSGISAHKGAHATEKGEFARFISLVENGSIPRGSLLIVESLDRLSREIVQDALYRFMGLLKKIDIVTLDDGMVYKNDSGAMQLMLSLVKMTTAHEESHKKSQRLQDVWNTKKSLARSEGKPIGAAAPLWLEYTPSGYLINETHAAIIRRVFQMSLDGYGKVTIAKTFNAEAIPSFKGKTWGTSSIQKILSNRALLGEYQPYTGRGKDRSPTGAPIHNYYPTVISEATFYQAQEAAAGRRIAGTTKQTARFNVWQGVSRCGVCLGPLHLVNKGKSPKGGTYLHCYAARKGLCKAKAIRLEQSELVFKEILSKVDSLSLVQASSASLNKQLSEIEGRLSIQEKKRIELSGAIDADFSQTLVDLLRKCEKIIASLCTEKEALLLALASETITDKEHFFAKLTEGNILSSYEGRYRANALLKRLKIKVYISRDDSHIKGLSTYFIRQDLKMVLYYICLDDMIIAKPLTDEQREKVKIQDWSKPLTITQDMFDDVNRRR